MTIHQKTALVIVNEERLDERLGRETLVITGSSRGGTSIPAYCLARAGMDIGDISRQPNHEDRAIIAAYRNNDMQTIIEQRNAERSRWGFKMPYAANILSDLDKLLRDPVFIIAYRNPLAIARTVINRDRSGEQTKGGLFAGLRHGLDFMLVATRQASEVSAPMILLDVDMAKRDSRLFVGELLHTMGVTPDTLLIDSIASEIAQSGYKRPAVA